MQLAWYTRARHICQMCQLGMTCPGAWTRVAHPWDKDKLQALAKTAPRGADAPAGPRDKRRKGTGTHGERTSVVHHLVETQP